MEREGEGGREGEEAEESLIVALGGIFTDDVPLVALALENFLGGTR